MPAIPVLSGSAKFLGVGYLLDTVLRMVDIRHIGDDESHGIPLQLAGECNHTRVSDLEGRYRQPDQFSGH